MLEHYSQGNEYSLCTTSYTRSLQRIAQLTPEDLENLRRLPSFRSYIESILDAEPRRVVKLLTDDHHLKAEMKTFVGDIFRYIMLFHCFIRVLLVLVKDLPHAPLGKLLRTTYVHCFNQKENVVDSKEFKDCWRIMGNVSKDQLISTIQIDVVQAMDDYLEEHCSELDDPIIHDVHNIIQDTQEDILKNTIEIMTAQATSISTSGELNKAESRDGIQQVGIETIILIDIESFIHRLFVSSEIAANGSRE